MDQERHKYKMVFRKILSDSVFVPYTVTCSCTEGEIQGMREHIAMELEHESGCEVICWKIEREDDSPQVENG